MSASNLGSGTSSTATWQEVLEGRLEPLSALMRGLLELKKGTIAALAPYAQAAQELVKVAREVA